MITGTLHRSKGPLDRYRKEETRPDVSWSIRRVQLGKNMTKYVATSCIPKIKKAAIPPAPSEDHHARFAP